MYVLPIDYTKLSSQERKEVRLQYVEEQGNLCCHCRRSLDERSIYEKERWYIRMELFPPNFLKHKIHLHHCHVTGMTIGAVHAYCNAVLWQYHGE